MTQDLPTCPTCMASRKPAGHSAADCPEWKRGVQYEQYLAAGAPGSFAEWLRACT